MTVTHSDETYDALQFLVDPSRSRLEDRDLTRERILAGLSTAIYGDPFGQVIRYAKQLVVDGHYSSLQMAVGLEIAGSLYERANARYLDQDNPITGEALAKHHEAVRNGGLTPVDAAYAMNVPNCVDQVIQADRAFRGDTIGAQAAVSAANYGAIFSNTTMTTGSRITEKLRGKESPYELDEVSYSGMTHLDSSNLIIGNTVEGIIEHSILVHGAAQSIRVFDIGSGHGATLAAIMHSVASRIKGPLPLLAFTGIEATPVFYKELCEFMKGPFGAACVDLDLNLTDSSDNCISQFGEINLVQGDVSEAIRNMVQLPLHKPSETTVVVANYAFHRLPSDKKNEIIKKFADQENVIFVIGDLMQNTSFINARHFNLAINGPLNTGNRSLIQHLAQNGFQVIDPADGIPLAVDQRLGKNIVGDSIDPLKDGHLFIAVKGERALAALGLVTYDSPLAMTRHSEPIAL
ncbi:MAG: hypothetical protein U0R17_06935 [Acidimicrobiia bacterium]